MAAGAYHDYDVSSAVTANGTYAFLTTTTSTDATDVASRENTSVNRPPLLELRIDPPPDTSVDSGPPAITNSASASFAFSSNDAGSTFACKLDAAAYAPCTSPAAYSGLANGSHTLSVRATDVWGSTDPSPASYTWTVDTAPPPAPTVALTPDSDTGASSTDRITNDTSPTFTGTAEHGTVVTVSADALLLGSAVANAAGDWTLASEDLPAGGYTITATVEDGAGNNSSPSSGLSLTIDTTPPPDPSITDPAADLATSSRTVTVSGTADPGLAVEVLDGTSTAATPDRRRLGRLDDGPDGPRRRGPSHLRRHARRRRKPVPAGEAHGHGRHRRARHHDHVRAARPDDADDGDLRVHVVRGRRDVRVSPRRRRVRLVLRRRRPTTSATGLTLSRCGRSTPRGTWTAPRRPGPGP